MKNFKGENNSNNKNNTSKSEGGGDTNCNWCFWKNPQRLGKGTWQSWKPEDKLGPFNYSIVDISRNTEKGSGHLKRFSITQTPVKDHVTADKRNSKGIIIYILMIHFLYASIK